MENEGFTPPKPWKITSKNEGFGFPWLTLHFHSDHIDLRKASFTSCSLMSSIFLTSEKFSQRQGGKYSHYIQAQFVQEPLETLTDIIFGDYIYYILLLYLH